MRLGECCSPSIFLAVSYALHIVPKYASPLPQNPEISTINLKILKLITCTTKVHMKNAKLSSNCLAQAFLNSYEISSFEDLAGFPLAKQNVKQKKNFIFDQLHPAATPKYVSNFLNFSLTQHNCDKMMSPRESGILFFI